MKTKRIIAAFMATTMLATTSITANAADYYYAGNQAMADGVYGGTSAVIDNIGHLVTDLFVPIDELSVDALVEYGMSEGMSDAIDSIMGDGFSEVIEYMGSCYYAYKDLLTAQSELGRAWEDEYSAMITAHYTTSYNGCIRLAKSALASGISGKIIPDANLASAQTFINDCKEEVAYLRKQANKYKFRKFKNNIRDMADELEALYKSINLHDIYTGAYNAYKLSQTATPSVQQNYESIYNRRTIGTSGSFAAVGMAASLLKGYHITEYDVYAANQYRTDIYWYVTESALRLDDQVTKFGSEVGTADKINRLISLSSNAKSGIVIQVNSTDYDQLRYLLAVGGSNGDLLVLDPISGSSSSISLKQLCANYGLDYGATVSRIRSVWSYNLY